MSWDVKGKIGLKDA
jgi:hypothetical protein